MAIASTGRPEALRDAVAAWRGQERMPDIILLSVASPADLPGGPKGALIAPDQIGGGVESVVGPRGSTTQRNTALDALGDRADLIGFFDDDYIPSRRAIAGIAEFFDAHPEIAGATGDLLADGANGPGVPHDDAERRIRAHDARPPAPAAVLRQLHGLYGCNMVVRHSAIGATRFDERLRLYGWQEDIDFSAQLRAHGVLVKTDAFAGVHLGVKTGRTSGTRFGYSQVVNPIYLSRKGTMRAGYAVRIIAKGMIANHLRLLNAEPWLDRAGRAKGNWLGLVDCLRGRVTPERVETLA